MTKQKKKEGPGKKKRQKHSNRENKEQKTAVTFAKSGSIRK
jgi:hypothetical protein